MKKTTYTLISLLLASSVALPALFAGNLASPVDTFDKDVHKKIREGFVPEITAPVNDYAGIIPPAQKKTISDMILAHRKKTGVQMAVLTVYTTGGMNIEEFSLKTAEKWGGGARGRDDGLLFTVALSDRRMRIEVGYGLEGYITDLKAGRILDGIRDDFRNYKYGDGIQKAVTQIILATDEVRPGQEAPATVRMWGAFNHLVDCYIFFFLLGGLFAVLLILGKLRKILNVPATIIAGVFLFIGLPVLFQFFFHGVWYWTPTLYLMGAFAGGSMTAAILVPEKKKSKIIAAVIMGVPVVAAMAAIVWLIQILKPVAEGTSKNETMLLGILITTNFIQFCIFGGLGGSTGGGDSYSSGGSSSSSSDSSSSSSSDSSSYSGGGGGFGGGGASSSW